MDLFRGKHIIPKNEKNFYEICNSLRNFNGVMRLFGKFSGEFYAADLLIHDGFIIAITLENLEKGEIYLGNNALTEIKEKFIKSASGRLDLYQLDENDLEKVRKDNLNAILKEKIAIEKIGMRITPHEPKKIKEVEWKKEEKGVFGKISFQQRGFDLPGEVGIIERPTIVKEEKKEEEEFKITEIPKLLKGVPTEEFERKKSLLEKIAKERGRIDRKIAERILGLWKEKPKEVKGEGKVKTSIDKFYELIQQHKTLKINDALATKLNVRRTQLENWAIILEEHDLVELHYPAIGEPEIKIKKKEDEEWKKK